MIIIACIHCAFAIRVMPLNVTLPRSVQEVHQLVGQRSEFWPDRYPCPRCNKMARGMLEVEAELRALRLMELRDLTPYEAFAALNGLGLPEETRCSLAIVNELLTRTPVAKVIGTDIVGQERTTVDAIELVDGTRVYFGAGAEGACVYRIAPPAIPYTERVLQEETGHGS